MANEIVKVGEKVQKLAELKFTDMEKAENIEALCAVAVECNDAMKAWKAENDLVYAEAKRICGPRINEVGDKVTLYAFDSGYKMEVLMKDLGQNVDDKALVAAIEDNFGAEMLAACMTPALDMAKVDALVKAGVLPEKFVGKFVSQKSAVSAQVKKLTKAEAKAHAEGVLVDCIG